MSDARPAQGGVEGSDDHPGIDPEDDAEWELVHAKLAAARAWAARERRRGVDTGIGSGAGFRRVGDALDPVAGAGSELRESAHTAGRLQKGIDRGQTGEGRAHKDAPSPSAPAWTCPLNEEAAGEIARHALTDRKVVVWTGVTLNHRQYLKAADAGEYRSPVLTFTGYLKGNPTFEGLLPWEAAKIVDDVFGTGDWSGHLPDLDTKENHAPPRLEFLKLWADGTLKPLAPRATPDDALRLAVRFELETDRWPSDADALYRRAVSICFWLARLLDQEGRFFMPCRRLGELLGCSHTAAGALLRIAEGEGLIERVEAHSFPRRRAVRWRFRFEAVGNDGRVPSPSRGTS